MEDKIKAQVHSLSNMTVRKSHFTVKSASAELASAELE